jgi:hypothetical protein
MARLPNILFAQNFNHSSKKELFGAAKVGRWFVNNKTNFARGQCRLFFLGKRAAGTTLVVPCVAHFL